MVAFLGAVVIVLVFLLAIMFGVAMHNATAAEEWKQQASACPHCGRRGRQEGPRD